MYFSDSIVFQGVSKANLDCSIKLAKEIKGSSTVCQGSKESTDHPWISRNVIKLFNACKIKLAGHYCNNPSVGEGLPVL